MPAIPTEGTMAPWAWTKRVLVLCFALLGLALALGMPFSFAWLYQSGDLAVERAVEAQQEGFALYGPGWGLEDRQRLAYGIRLHAARKPAVLVLGSASAGQFRQPLFSRPVVNMAGTASSLPELAAALDQALAVHRPEVVLIGIDFWWFAPAWDAHPLRRADLPAEGAGYLDGALRRPWQWLLQGRISLRQFLSPLWLGMRKDRFGARAQCLGDGFGPDGAWYPFSLLKAALPPEPGFAGALRRLDARIGEFAPCPAGPGEAHIDAFADVYYRIKGRGMLPLVYLSPLASPLSSRLKADPGAYRHLFGLKQALAARGIDLLDASAPETCGIQDCEFLDGLRMGEVASCRLLREFANARPELLAYVDMERVSRTLNEWPGHAFVRDERIDPGFETDFLGLGCRKRTP